MQGISMSKSARLRTVWWTLHRWIGIGLAILLVPIAVSGALLVWHDHLDALIHPGRYAVSGGAFVAPSPTWPARRRRSEPACSLRPFAFRNSTAGR